MKKLCFTKCAFIVCIIFSLSCVLTACGNKKTESDESLIETNNAEESDTTEIQEDSSNESHEKTEKNILQQCSIRENDIHSAGDEDVFGSDIERGEVRSITFLTVISIVLDLLAVLFFIGASKNTVFMFGGIFSVCAIFLI